MVVLERSPVVVPYCQALIASVATRTINKVSIVQVNADCFSVHSALTALHPEHQVRLAAWRSTGRLRGRALSEPISVSEADPAHLHLLQLLLSYLTPNSHALATRPFLGPSAFLSSLSGLSSARAHPSTSLWRTSSGLLRAIKLARKMIEPPVPGTPAGGSDVKANKLPSYVVVITGTDVAGPEGDELSLSDDEDEGADDWAQFAQDFTKVSRLVHRCRWTVGAGWEERLRKCVWLTRLPLRWSGVTLDNALLTHLARQHSQPREVLGSSQFDFSLGCIRCTAC